MRSELTPMFPLGSVLVPHMLLPLRVFEARYRAMIDDVMDTTEEFGVVLIERGFEVGGGDARFDVGTVARVLDITELEDGHLLVLSAGTQRLRVTEWLDDDPYPRARVERCADQEPESPMAGEIEALEQTLRRCCALMAELGYNVGPFDRDLARDPTVAGYQAITLSPLSMLDRQELLELDSSEMRLHAVHDRLRDQVELFEQQLAAG